MLTQEIRKSLDRHTILYTTLVELSKTLDLHNCAVWMPNENRTELHLTHELKGNSKNYRRSIPVNDPDVLEIQGSKGVKVLRPDSALGASSGRELEESGAVAAIRMPMLQVSNFKGGTPELVDTCYAILVLVLPSMSYRGWSHEEMEIVEVVADQARNDAMMASQARNSFQKVMSHGMRRPMHSILGLLSMFQNDNMGFEQRIVTDTLVKTGNVLATLINDVMDISAEDTVRFPLEMRPFRLHSMIKEASCLAKCLCVYKGFDFELDVQSSLPDLVIGDERRAFQVILHMVGYLLNIFDGGGNVIFRVFSESDSEGKSDRMLGMWKTNAPDEFVSVKFDMEMREGSSLSDGASSTPNSSGRRRNSAEAKEGLGFIMCKRLVQR
ncbi:ETHYLENE RECEPTOR [Salix koriyanagi]|uniref:histidine kinase n=1 Tax=Salix koriyanagi TaxID=2511006 RepID=A0A9Q1A7T9_9ROSI|nr:ETHYLENE RECEPTOR [Salix koriyanagi]